MKPDFISQAVIHDIDERRAWWAREAQAAQEKGARHHRFSYHPVQTDLLLYEGWKEQPEDWGDPNFMFQAEADDATTAT